MQHVVRNEWEEISLYQRPCIGQESSGMDILPAPGGGFTIRLPDYYTFPFRRSVSAWLKRPTVYILGLLVAIVCWWCHHYSDSDDGRGAAPHNQEGRTDPGPIRHTNTSGTQCDVETGPLHGHGKEEVLCTEREQDVHPSPVGHIPSTEGIGEWCV